MSHPALSVVNRLRERIRQIEGRPRHGVLPFGVTAIDGALPGGGLALGAVHEILGAGGDEEDGAAAAGFIAGILARLGGSGGSGGSGRAPVLWCLGRCDLYGAGLPAHGLDPARLVLVEARRDADLLWAVEEGLRTPALAAVVGEVGRLPMVAGRRLQLAAERSGVTALLLRRWPDAALAAAERQRPSAAVTRWRIAALPSARRGLGLGIGRPRWRIELLRVRGGVPAQWDVEGDVEGDVEVADATGFVSLSAGLADRSAAAPRPDTRYAQRQWNTDGWRRAG
ncbi:MAG: ImuA family protein [Thiohalocapsa sp.]